jgi:2-C-methyl-D-erythritol 4-phosphate cytidylyltransferase/2-C-methyl-D-erythritol 2,4-cyclodiphosphate synthase
MSFARHNHIILLAAGRGERFGGNLPKQFIEVHGRPLLYFSLETFLEHESIASVCVVLPEQFIDFPLPNHPKLLSPVIGGHLRHLSTRNGLKALRCKPNDGVLIHDAARPLVPASLIGEVCLALNNCDAVTPALPIEDALLERDHLHIVDRARYGIVQTPQGFRHSVLEEAFTRSETIELPSNRIPSCEFELVRALLPSANASSILGHHKNFKITHRHDLENLPHLLRKKPTMARNFDGFVRIATAL